MEHPDNIKKYLPSKKFTRFLLIVLGIGILFFLIFNVFSIKNRFVSEKKQKKLAVQQSTVNDLIQKDTDGDGVFDWEEALWGTDLNKTATFDEKNDLEYINDRKKILNISNAENINTDLSATDQFAREFFTAYSAMKASGEVDQDIINNFSNALGQKIINPELINIYTFENIKTTSQNSSTENKKYYENISNLFQKSKKAGIGDELAIISNSLVSNTTSQAENDQLLKIGKAYKDFAQQIIQNSVPSDLADLHLSIANNAHNTGLSVENMSKVMNDPVIGILGISQYEKYSQDLIDAAKKLENVL